MSKPFHSFSKSLAVGAAGEAWLLRKWPFLEKLDGRRSDFVVEQNKVLVQQVDNYTREGLVFKAGETLELKTDSYSMDKTANFFIEFWSDVDKGKPGGPIQAQLHGSTYWLYVYAKDEVGFLFHTEQLAKFIEEKVAADKDCWPSSLIPNRSWTTMGYRVPREDLKHLYVEINFKGDNK